MKTMIKNAAVVCLAVAGACASSAVLAQTVEIKTHFGHRFVDMTPTDEGELMTWNQAMRTCAAKGLGLPKVEHAVQLQGKHMFPSDRNPIPEEYRLGDAFYWTSNPVDDFGQELAVAVHFGGKKMEALPRSSKQRVRCMKR